MVKAPEWRFDRESLQPTDVMAFCRVFSMRVSAPFPLLEAFVSYCTNFLGRTEFDKIFAKLEIKKKKKSTSMNKDRCYTAKRSARHGTDPSGLQPNEISLIKQSDIE